MKYKLFEPGLNCANCHLLYIKNKKRPACLMNLCPIVDIAGNMRLNRMADAFLQVEVLALTPGYAPFQERILQDSGLCDESAQTILEMKSVLADYRDWQAKKGKKIRST